MAEISNLLAILQLPEESANVKSLLIKFLALDDIDKANCRISTAEKIFSLVFGNDATLQSEANFTEQRETTWSTNCRLTPSVIVTPQTSHDVGKALALCRFLGVKFSVRSGGHLHNPGFTSNNSGVVLLMKKFNTVTLSEDRATAEIGVGQNWLEVYKALEEYDLTVTGGRQPVGVAGLLLGGGLSFQNSGRGMSCHGVVEYEIVLADSSIAKVNATNNKDLFWALKGGGPNFGILTKVTMSTISNKFWCDVRIYTSGENTELLKCIMDYHEANEKDSKANIICFFDTNVTMVVLIYAEPVEEKPAVFNSFDGIECASRVAPPKVYTVYEMVSLLEPFTITEPKSHDMRVMTSRPDLDVYNAAEAARLQQLEEVKDVPGAKITLVIQPISSSTSRACDKQGGNPLGLKAEPQQWLLVMMEWSHSEDESIILEASRQIIDQAEAVAKKNGTYIDFKYSNYASRDQDPLATYGSENVDRLRSIAKEVDPQGVFQELQNDGWLLSKTASTDTQTRY